MPPFTHTSSWHNAYLIKHGDNFNFLPLEQRGVGMQWLMVRMPILKFNCTLHCM
jgi:hypothetical protein